MGDVVFRRRGTAADDPSPVVAGELVLQTPPELPRPTPQPLLPRVLPLVMLVAVVGSLVVMIRGGMARSPMALMFPAMMAVSALGMAASAFGGGARTAEIDEARKDYLRYLGRTRQEVRATARAQRASWGARHPGPDELQAMVGAPTMWARGPGDPDALTVRVGTGRQALATRLHLPDTGPVDDLEPVSVVALRRFVRVHSLVEGLPVALQLDGFAAVSVDGEVDRVRALVRAVVAALVTSHGPDDVRVALAAREPESRAAWEWLKWLPHHQHPEFTDGAGTVRLNEYSIGGVAAMLAGELADRERFPATAAGPTALGRRAHLVVVVDGVPDTGGEVTVLETGLDGVTLLEVCGSRSGAVRALAVERGLRLRIDGDRLVALTAEGDEAVAEADAMSVPEAETLARAMARYRTPERHDASGGGGAPGGSPGLPELLGLGQPHLVDPAVAWRRRAPRERLRVPVGVTADGTPVELDLKEAAQGGMGPHGLCVGATGSGKSEFLRTLVLGLVATHDPETLNLVLVDFKGGATFLGMESLAHVSAVITNLQAELGMVDRMRAALEGELTRRQELLRAAGNLANVTDYEAARARGARLEPLPALFVVVDEFSELLSSRPDYADLFVMIGRLGRSLHIHLLLASQRLEEGRLRGLDSHLSYRIALKTFSAAESRSVLGVPDAYHLPSTPGAGYLKADSADPVRFDTAYVSGPVARPRPTPEGPAVAGSAPARIRPFTAWYMPVPSPRTEPSHAPAPTVGPPAEVDRRSLLEVLVGRLSGHGRPAHEVWLEPLGAGTSLGAVLPGLRAAHPDRVADGLLLPVAEIDLPFEQRRAPMVVDLSGGDGHVAIVGGARSGKSTSVRTLVLAAACLATPDRIWVYALDLGGGALGPLATLPHVGTVAHRGEPDRVRRTVAEVIAERRRRESAFRAAGVTSIDQARTLTTTDEGRELRRFPDVVLVVDGWQVLRSEFEDLEAGLTALAADGPAFGVHLVVTAARWADIRPALRDALSTRVELRLGEATDSVVDRRTAITVPAVPGRGLTPDRHHMLVLQPRLDEAGPDPDAGFAAAVAEVSGGWAERMPGVGARPVRLLPGVVQYAELAALARPEPGRRRTRVPIGVEETELQAVYADLAADPLTLVFGDSGSGKTSLLRCIGAGVVAGNDPEASKLLVVDYRRGMLDRFTGPHLAGYAAGRTALEPMVDHLVRVLTERMPGPETTPEQLRERSWWSGPEITVLVDDLDLVITSAGNPLAPLAPFLPHARDVGLALVAARRTAGAARALFDPVVGGMRDLGCAGVLLDGSRDEGPLVHGVRPESRPPGRGVVVTRASGARLVQTAWCP